MEFDQAYSQFMNNRSLRPGSFYYESFKQCLKTSTTVKKSVLVAEDNILKSMLSLVEKLHQYSAKKELDYQEQIEQLNHDSIQSLNETSVLQASVINLCLKLSLDVKNKENVTDSVVALHKYINELKTQLQVKNEQIEDMQNQLQKQVTQILPSSSTVMIEQENSALKAENQQMLNLLEQKDFQYSQLQREIKSLEKKASIAEFAGLQTTPDSNESMLQNKQFNDSRFNEIQQLNEQLKELQNEIEQKEEQIEILKLNDNSQNFKWIQEELIQIKRKLERRNRLIAFLNRKIQ
ncbi:Hypothetical_protein [Hexamita inflata]|uniref:Hypothetical_protein n=1 Tax=Hexamita inflata TaxID=28002 RepID=A0AA86P8V7_9EUKA|nr:Hypothetical protein HINF_LOCUS20753 [Hexamita inflata]CAI9954956.1 Hypothetical protein HINF_LOCUS42601 [Hexamita inflata]